VDTEGKLAGRHLTSSLKELSLMGADKVVVYGSDSIDIDLGTSAFGQSDGNKGNIGGANFLIPGLFADPLDVTLNVGVDDQGNLDETQIATDVAGVAHMAEQLKAMGIDHIDLGGSGFNGAVSIDQVAARALIDAGLTFAEDDDVTLQLGKGKSLSELALMADVLREAGIDHISLAQQQMDANAEATSLIMTAGMDFSLLADTPPAFTGSDRHASLPEDYFSIVQDGVDFLVNMLSSGASMGDLLGTLSESGIHSIDIVKPDYVTIGDDLASALYESGMLHALPEANVQIDAGFADQVQTTLKAMADLGVDHVLAKEGAKVDLGADFSELASLLGHFVSDTDPTSTKAIFDHGAELNMGQVTGYTADTLQSLLESGMGQQLQDLGISKVVAQVMPPVDIIGGTNTADGMVFDLDILNKKF